MSRKNKKEEKREQLAIKDFFDRVLPGVLKFYSDHYICGDSYRCVWAIKEYPPSTEEQAILRQLADRTHVTLRLGLSNARFQFLVFAGVGKVLKPMS